jgi:hypothetical protein
MKAPSVALKIVVAVLALTASLWAQDGLEGALRRANLTSAANLGTPFRQTVAAADFDGDNQPDGAVLVDGGWGPSQTRFRTIELHFTGRRNTDLSFESNETTLAISALDVNRDGATDIVLEQALTHKRLQVWLNDGHGDFHNGRIEDFPSEATATGDRHFDLPSQGIDSPAVGLPLERRSQVPVLRASTLPSRLSSGCERALAFESAFGSRAVAASSPRAPPSSLLL